MAEHDDDLAEMFRGGAPAARTPTLEEVMGRVQRRARRRRRARLAGTALVAVVALLVVGGAVVNGRSSPDGTSVSSGGHDTSPTTTGAPTTTVAPVPGTQPPNTTIGPDQLPATDQPPVGGPPSGAATPGRESAQTDTRNTTSQWNEPATPPTTTTPPPTYSQSGPALPRLEPLHELALAAQAEFGASYAGIDASQGQPVIYVKADRPLPTSFQGAPVVGVAYSLAELESGQAHAEAVAIQLQNSVILSPIGPDFAKNRIVIGIVDRTPSKESTVLATLGAGPWHIVDGTQYQPL